MPQPNLNATAAAFLKMAAADEANAIEKLAQARRSRRYYVQIARDHGMPWQDIARALNTSPEGARKAHERGL